MEKHRDLLIAENEHLKQDMKSCEAELQKLKKQHVKCIDCEHIQVARSRGWGVQTELFIMYHVLAAC